ncbi:MAG: phosphotransferase [Deltaproteobacteria bacterium]|nr:phosphotransferase [Deltaproteobacteria bacterium]
MTDEAVAADVPAAVLSRWGAFAAAVPTRFGTGLINRTFLVDNGGSKAVLQRLHPIFKPAVNDDLDAVTAWLEKKGLVTPRLLRTDDGASCVAIAGESEAEGETWRLITFVAGTSVDKLASPEQARAAGTLVAGFHAAVEDLGYAYQHVREGVHDTRKHLVKLARMLAKHRNHRLANVAGSLGKEILDAGARLPDLTKLPVRHAHGDLKISNLLFDDDGKGLCLCDLDTLQKLSWPIEMGDALRSWCNPSGEDVEAAGVSLDLFRAAVEGYFSAPKKPFLMPDETAHLVDGLLTICVELSARFCADALDESYFGWDNLKYKTRGDHNLVRARGQWSLAKSVRDHKAELEAIVKNATR